MPHGTGGKCNYSGLFYCSSAPQRNQVYQKIFKPLTRLFWHKVPEVSFNRARYIKNTERLCFECCAFIPIPFLCRSYCPVQENQFDIRPSYGTHNIFSLLPGGSLRHISILVCSLDPAISEQSLHVYRQDKTNLNHLHLSIAHAS